MLQQERSTISIVARRFRSRAVLELENLALRFQLHVLRRQRLRRPRLFTFDRWLWVWLYRLWPRCLDTMVLVNPATVIQWHRQGFRLFWRWRSRSGRPTVDREVSKLIREMSIANPPTPKPLKSSPRCGANCSDPLKGGFCLVTRTDVTAARTVAAR